MPYSHVSRDFMGLSHLHIFFMETKEFTDANAGKNA